MRSLLSKSHCQELGNWLGGTVALHPYFNPTSESRPQGRGPNTVVIIHHPHTLRLYLWDSPNRFFQALCMEDEGGSPGEKKNVAADCQSSSEREKKKWNSRPQSPPPSTEREKNESRPLAAGFLWWELHLCGVAAVVQSDVDLIAIIDAVPQVAKNARNRGF